ncbi:bifunctional 3-(3-hydroxy-phenyl)propionate/3-hydroxycinnamic acid hydroxylase [Shimwellia pseudoproteus]|uniref:bifunctional 3-(3-hydroxy-phenyl)propionate/3-hydroxycinnamic acid hydroxylase MhpA n=1 Tax=Shimwellia pseudoproteus TaxID=570012 RepID=UPI0018EDD686|nr:bifunctional 3-(3-hydroxy-phenyl)propionate/3-hydroxycinnamic acid hydroxylase [Shimwellia pseudoproteus]MBJ3816752.1 bifunctional 3-(3-hydroxy-phenyl)propionate/3-hydroxycinnamic acid hydroxylase [Shimwellia pseudoproteus]
MNDKMFDVAIVGYGPVGQLLALILGRMNYQVVVYERWESLYPLPRAVFHDHEIRRMLRLLGLEEEVAAISHPASAYQWFNADWQQLVEIDWACESISDGPYGYFFNQPELEAIFDRQVKQLDNVSLRQGWEVKTLTQHPDNCVLSMVRTAQHQAPDAPVSQVRARYVIGADGANSTIRRECGINWLDLGFAEDWLVVDVKPHDGVELDLPAAAQWCNPQRPTTLVPGGPHYRRWEFMRLPHETLEDLQHTEKVWSLLSEWATPEQVTLIRHAVYQFRSRIAEQWHQGRVVLAGDAAHLMPPFMGQGMCSGLRDVWNLSWRLDKLLSGQASPAVLDDYTAERKPQIRAVIEASMAMGRVVCVSDPQQAADRDTAYLTGQVAPLPPFPGITDGLIYRTVPSPVAGTLSVHGALRRQQHTARFDTLFGRGFHLVISESGVNASQLPALAARLSLAGGQVVVVSDNPDSETAYYDVSGKYLDFMRQHNVSAFLVRPDFYIYGAASQWPDITAMVDALVATVQPGAVAETLAI